MAIGVSVVFLAGWVGLGEAGIDRAVMAVAGVVFAAGQLVAPSQRSRFAEPAGPVMLVLNPYGVYP